MTSNKLLAVGVFLLSVASIGMPAMAGERGKKCDGKHHAGAWAGHKGFEGRNFRHAEKSLGLTDIQKETLKTQRQADKAARNALHANLADAHKALAAAVDAGANDAELGVLAEAVGKLQAEQILAGAKARKAFIAVLTEEQKQTLAEVRSKRLERKEGRRDTREPVKS